MVKLLQAKDKERILIVTRENYNYLRRKNNVINYDFLLEKKEARRHHNKIFIVERQKLLVKNSVYQNILQK